MYYTCVVILITFYSIPSTYNTLVYRDNQSSKHDITISNNFGNVWRIVLLVTIERITHTTIKLRLIIIFLPSTYTSINLWRSSKTLSFELSLFFTVTECFIFITYLKNLSKYWCNKPQNSRL